MIDPRHMQFAARHRALSAKEPWPDVAAAHIRFAEEHERLACPECSPLTRAACEYCHGSGYIEESDEEIPLYDDTGDKGASA